MNVIKKFLELTSRTYPHGTESQIEQYLPDNLLKDEFGNYYIEVGDPNSYTTMFTSHFDTACSNVSKVKHKFSKDGKFVRTNGKTILGADCKAGVVIMLNMIEHNVPGLYYFFLGEEVGCLGSKWLSKKMYNGEMFPNNKISKVISFDRRGTNSIITYQWAGRCASDKFADSLSSEFRKYGMEMRKDETGMCTDSIQFQDFIPECTNISVGYYSEHTMNERQDISFLKTISDVVLKIDWESLVVNRDPSVSDYGSYYESWEEEEEIHIDGNKTWSEKYTTFVRHPQTGESVEVFLSCERIEYEKKIIEEILLSWGFDEESTSEVEWNGRYLIMSFDGENMDSLSRNDLIYSDKRLSTIKSEDYRVKEHFDVLPEGDEPF